VSPLGREVKETDDSEEASRNVAPALLSLVASATSSAVRSHR
jgi:hypothetical protein